MPKLKWIDDNSLTVAVKNILNKARNAKIAASQNFGKNVVDPFSAIFEMTGFGMTFDNWILSEEARQSQKTLQNFIGEFHQTILGSCIDWTDMTKGNIIDLLSNKNKIIAEVKNKYNTISGGKLAELYSSLESAVMNKTSIYKGYTAYYVSIIPEKPSRFNKPFTPSNKETGSRCPENPFIRQIDGASFYALVTGQRDALQELFEVLPIVISEVSTIDLIESERLKALFKIAYG